MKASKDTRFSKYETPVAPFFSWKRQEFYINVFKGTDDAFDQIKDMIKSEVLEIQFVSFILFEWTAFWPFKESIAI